MLEEPLGDDYVVGSPPEVEAGDNISRIPEGEFDLVDTVCVSIWPFPGEGNPWPVSGLNGGMAKSLDVYFAQFGRRLATATESLILYATSSNDRWPSGVESWTEAECDPDPNNPKKIGSYPKCKSRSGVSGMLTFAMWVRIDDQMRKHLEAHGMNPWEKEYCIAGGMPTSWEAYYGDDLWGWHCHSPEETPYDDDRTFYLVALPHSVTVEQQNGFEEAVVMFVASGGDWGVLIPDATRVSATATKRSHRNSRASAQ
ncbi:hypothetical protein HY734_03750 [Candidatus Uhrbacteria bacterium]|nr:hypothetical protein [Candidatus Uhrbacteria bacterium]